jgi:hypothetical protein
LVTGGPIDERLAENIVELILRGFAPDPPRGSKLRRTQPSRTKPKSKDTTS